MERYYAVKKDKGNWSQKGQGREGGSGGTLPWSRHFKVPASLYSHGNLRTPGSRTPTSQLRAVGLGGDHGVYWAVIDKYRSPGSLKNRKLFSHFSGARSRERGLSRAGFFEFCLPGPKTAGFSVSSHRLPSGHVCAPISSSYKDTIHIGSVPTLGTSFSLNHLFQDPISKCSRSLQFWGEGLQHRDFGGDTIQSVTRCW